MPRKPGSISSRSVITIIRGCTIRTTRDSPGRYWGAIAAKTSRIGLATGVTCPFVRYHPPAIVAQAAATTALLSDGRFVLGLGSGERLNEHVVARGWPAAATRTAMLRESIEVIRLLWSGGYHSYDGRHIQLEDARVFDLPTELPPRSWSPARAGRR